MLLFKVGAAESRFVHSREGSTTGTGSPRVFSFPRDHAGNPLSYWLSLEVVLNVLGLQEKLILSVLKMSKWYILPHCRELRSN
jgi:hypothetical protein